MAAARKPQDRKPKQTAPEPPEAVTVSLRGQEWTIGAEVLNDMEFLEAIESINGGNLLGLPRFSRQLLGPEQYERAKVVARDPETGRTTPQALMEFIGELIGAPSSAGEPLGESAAS